MKQAFTFVFLFSAYITFGQSFIESARFCKAQTGKAVTGCAFEIEPGQHPGLIYLTLNGLFIPYTVTNKSVTDNRIIITSGDIVIECVIKPPSRKPLQVSVGRRNGRKTTYFN